jgi:hypothetical protein
VSSTSGRVGDAVRAPCASPDSSLIGALLSAAILIAIATPIVAALVGVRLRWSVVASFVPGVALICASLVARATGWGGQSVSRSEDVSNAYALLVAGVLSLMAGLMGTWIASVVTRLRRGPGWSRRA